MKHTNKIDKLGRIVVPIKMRNVLGIEQGTAFNVTLYEKSMILEVRSEESKIVGSIRKIDELGRIVLPVEFRNALGLAKNNKAKIALVGNQIHITKEEKDDEKSRI